MTEEETAEKIIVSLYMRLFRAGFNGWEEIDWPQLRAAMKEDIEKILREVEKV